jgi:hypothetical protein
MKTKIARAANVGGNKKLKECSQMQQNKLAEINVVTDGGPWALHNMPCAVCGVNHAVIELWNGHYQPCWKCQNIGYRLLRLPLWLSHGILKRIFNQDARIN